MICVRCFEAEFIFILLMFFCVFSAVYYDVEMMYSFYCVVDLPLQMWASVGQILTVVILISNLIVKYGSGIAISLVLKQRPGRFLFLF